MYFYSVVSGALSGDTNKVFRGVCVSECPTEKIKKSDYPDSNPYQLKCKPNGKKTDCEIKYTDYY